ncbi:MAG: hypothetical protein IPP85_12300 [Propionivibrio sp.]|nr:hypothetical protein [Propionivibrio sp.]
MIQSPASSYSPPDYRIGNPVRFGSQVSQQPGSGFSARRSASSASGQTSELSPEEQQQVQQLKQIDRKVRAHEQAHLAVGADLVRGGPVFSYTSGPDNMLYAVAGEVSIDTTPARTPEETIPKAQHIRATALAPADPSPQDRSVAAQAARMEGEARIELAELKREEAANANQDSTRIYRVLEQGDGNTAQVGGRLDLFA